MKTAIRIFVWNRMKSGMLNEHSDFNAEQLPQAGVHPSVASFPLLPCAEAAVNKVGSGGLRQARSLSG
nr:hypothetical protein [Laribacter hongkongensis]